MADKTHIEWTDATWNPVTGCSVVSPGCTNCYAMKLAGTRLKHHPSRKGLTAMGKAGPVWNGEVRLNEGWLDQPLRWKKPRRIFVCAHGDLFHEHVPDAWIDKVFAVMALAPQHTFQVLTKRPDRMADYLTQRDGMGSKDICRAINDIPPFLGNRHGALSMPLPNVWLGTSVEDQARADDRIPYLLATPAAVRFLSCEPLLGPVDLRPYLFIYTRRDAAQLDFAEENNIEAGPLPFNDPAVTAPEDIAVPRVDWVIVGGESGQGARDMNPQWAHDIARQCGDARVPFFMKQMARKKPIPADLQIRQMPGEGA